MTDVKVGVAFYFPEDISIPADERMGLLSEQLYDVKWRNIVAVELGDLALEDRSLSRNNGAAVVGSIYPSDRDVAEFVHYLPPRVVGLEGLQFSIISELGRADTDDALRELNESAEATLDLLRQTINTGHFKKVRGTHPYRQTVSIADRQASAESLHLRLARLMASQHFLDLATLDSPLEAVATLAWDDPTKIIESTLRVQTHLEQAGEQPQVGPLQRAIHSWQITSQTTAPFRSHLAPSTSTNGVEALVELIGIPDLPPRRGSHGSTRKHQATRRTSRGYHQRRKQVAGEQDE